MWKGTHHGSHRFAAVIFKIFLLALMQDASFGNFPPTLQGSFGAEKKRDLGNKFSQFFFFFFFEGGEKGVENQAAWLRALKQIKSCGKFIE